MKRKILLSFSILLIIGFLVGCPFAAPEPASREDYIGRWDLVHENYSGFIRIWADGECYLYDPRRLIVSKTDYSDYADGTWEWNSEDGTVKITTVYDEVLNASYVNYLDSNSEYILINDYTFERW